MMPSVKKTKSAHAPRPNVGRHIANVSARTEDARDAIARTARTQQIISGAISLWRRALTQKIIGPSKTGIIAIARSRIAGKIIATALRRDAFAISNAGAWDVKTQRSLKKMKKKTK